MGFGNGQTSDAENPPKAKYAATGVYDVILIAVKDKERAIYKQTFLIAADNNPAAHFSYSFKDQRTSVPAVVQFANESVNGVTFKWTIAGQTCTDVVIVNANADPQAGFVLAYHPYPYKVGEPIQFVNLSKNADAWMWTFGNKGFVPSTAEHPEVTFTTAGDYPVTLIAKKAPCNPLRKL